LFAVGNIIAIFQQGCSNCGFGFCAKCLNHKAVVPHLTDKPVSVCPPCYRKLTQQNSQVAVEYGPPRAVEENTSEHWWGPDELPPPSMRHKYPTPQRPFRRKSPRADCSQPPPYSEVCSTSDTKIEQRLNKLKSDRAILEGRGVEKIATVNEIEERLALLRGVPVEEIRNPSLMFARKRGEVRGESVKDLIEKAHDEVRIEKKWDPVKQLERRYNEYHHNVDVNNDNQEEELPAVQMKKFCEESPSSSGMNDDIIMDEDTVRGMKDLAKTLKLAEEESFDAAACAEASNKSAKRQMEEIAKLTRQKSLKNERINAELGRFWEKSFEKYGSQDGSEQDNEVDEEELQKVGSRSLVLELEVPVELFASWAA
uniref:FYVE-type domain-containing protein n=1 Tax=Toxocara canis TaxID=6265 RepID=A0A183US98_TOXCA